jgi:hypothetical protein
MVLSVNEISKQKKVLVKATPTVSFPGVPLSEDDFQFVLAVQ